MGPRHHTLVATARYLGISGAVALVIALGLVLWRQLRDFRDPLVSPGEDLDVLLATGWGTAWKLAVFGAALLLAAMIVAAPRGEARPFQRGAWVAATVLAGVMCAYPAFTGHAAGTEGLRWITIPADTVHVLAAGSWIGGLFFVLAAAAWERRRTGRGNALLAEVVPLFSPVALVAAALLIGSGALAANIHAGSLDALVETRYGRLLLTKMALVVMVLILGAINWRRYLPRLWEAGGALPLRRNATLELVLAHIVILITALLVRTPPLEG